MSYETYSLHWRGIDIHIRYHPDYSKSYQETYGVRLGHLEVRCHRPLPITETGYRSHFTPVTPIEEWGGPLEFVRAWLEKEAQSPQWKAQADQSRQLPLF